MRERSAQFAEDYIRKGEEESAIQYSRSRKVCGSTANAIATFVPDDRIASENRQRLKSPK